MQEFFAKIIAFIMTLVYTLFPSLSPKQHVDEYKINADKLYICVQTNASTGYSWVVKECNENVIKLTDRAIQKDAQDAENEKAGLVGAPSTEVLTFKAVSDGSFKIVLSYERSFEKNSSIKTRTLTGTVADGKISVDNYLIKD